MKTKRELTPTERFFHDLRVATIDASDEAQNNGTEDFEDLFLEFLQFARGIRRSLHFQTLVQNNGSVISAEFNPAHFCLLYHVLIGSGTAEDSAMLKFAYLDFSDEQLSVARFLHRMAVTHFPRYASFLEQNPPPEFFRAIQEEES